jgi:hypothetical protein
MTDRDQNARRMAELAAAARALRGRVDALETAREADAAIATEVLEHVDRRLGELSRRLAAVEVERRSNGPAG